MPTGYGGEPSKPPISSPKESFCPSPSKYLPIDLAPYNMEDQQPGIQQVPTHYVSVHIAFETYVSQPHTSPLPADIVLQ